jgi:hypothetical protein
MIPTYASYLFSHSLLLFDPQLTHVPITLVMYVIVVTTGGENGGLFLGAFFGKYKPVCMYVCKHYHKLVAHWCFYHNQIVASFKSQ